METMKRGNHINIRMAEERGYADYGWLKTSHSFSFADYHDPLHMGFRSLRVINEDWIDAQQGFGTHPHSNMEIITYVIDGELEHKDSTGKTSIIKAGNIQKMSAGTGIRHSEFNPSSSVKTHLLQIWILPDKRELAPSYEEIALINSERQRGLVLIGAKDGPAGTVHIQQDVKLYRANLKEEEERIYSVQQGRGIWIQMVKGKLHLNDRHLLSEGDGASVENEETLTIKAHKESEFLLFDLG